MEDKVVYFLTQFWTFFAVSIGVALGGVATKRVVAVFVPEERRVAAEERGPSRSSAAEVAIDPKLPLWYRVWRATISMHPVLVGGLCGLAPIPTAEWVPPVPAAHMLWFALAGALSGQVYDISRRLAEILPSVVRQRLGASPPPSEAPTEPKDPP